MSFSTNYPWNQLNLHSIMLENSIGKPFKVIKNVKKSKQIPKFLSICEK